MQPNSGTESGIIKELCSIAWSYIIKAIIVGMAATVFSTPLRQILHTSSQGKLSLSRLFSGLKGNPTSSISNMKDEYANMDSSGETYITKNFILESGVVLPEAQVRYNAFGKLNAKKDNLLVVCHALTGNSRLDQWWGSMLGPGKTFDTDKYLVVCANVLGSCYGTTGPRSLNPQTKELYGMSFPDVTIRDTVRLHMEMCTQGIGASGAAAVVSAFG